MVIDVRADSFSDSELTNYTYYTLFECYYIIQLIFPLNMILLMVDAPINLLRLF